MSLRLWAVTALLAASPLVSAVGKQKAPQQPVLGTDTVHGCYSSKGSMTKEGSGQFMSQGYCATACRKIKKPVGATSSSDCFCGDKYPPKSTLTKDENCSEPCPGFDEDACGGLDTFTVYNIGVRVSVAEEEDPSSSSSAGPDKTTAASTPVTVTDTPTASSDPKESEGGSTNTVGIAVGVVVGLLVVGAIGGAVFFVFRRKRNAEIEEEHRRNAAVNAFIAGGKPPSSSGGLSLSDQRLDPVIAHRRQSDGSIADNEDYSRRILRVTNA
jgi:cell wall integrity and stress response component